MMKIKLIVLGKLKEEYLREASKEYEKRLSLYCDIEILEIAPEKLPDKASETEILAALSNEAQKIIKQIPDDSAVYAMCIEGKQESSEDFAAEIKNFRDSGKKVTFIIGSSYGLAESVKSRASKKFSVSKMTFPHQLFRIMLLEQIYRACKIIEGGTYHK